MFRVLLINPPVPDNKVWVREGRCQQWDIWGAAFPPLSLALISAQLIKEKIETLIIDSGPENKNIGEVISESAKFKPDVVILSASSPTIETDLDWFVKKLKNKLPKIKVVVIGIHVSTLPEEVLKKFKLVDFVIMGEPEISCKELIKNIENRKSIDNIKGIAYRKGKKVVVNEGRNFLEDIDKLGFPDWEKINFKNYLLPIKGKSFSLISFSRGCPHNCKFCNASVYGGKRIRKRDIRQIVKEIEYNLSLGVNDFLFWTELMTGDKKYLESFLDLIIKEKLHKKISWVCNSRVDGADLRLFRKMKKAGCWQMAFGFEFGNNEILKLAQKGITATIEQGRKAANLASKAGILVDGHFIMGFPGETPETLQDTIDFACSLPLTFAHFYAAVPFPGSQLYTEAIKNKWIKRDNKWSQLNQNFSELSTKTLDPQTVNDYIKRAYKKFYFRPKVLIGGLKIPQSPREFFNLIKLGISFYGQNH